MNEQLTILLADGDQARRNSRRALLAGEDVVIYETGHGTEAVDLATRHQPDAVLLDLDLPALDGIEVYERLKADAKYTAPVMLSIAPSTSAMRRASAFACGADGYLIDPVEPEVAAAALRSTMRLGRATRELSSIGGRVRAVQTELEQFASQICHDVEEPLRAVTTFVQLVEERGPEALTPTERSYLEHVTAASARVRSLLRGFVSYTQAGSGRRAHFGRLDLRAPALAAAQSLRQRTEESKTEIRFEAPWPVVWGDFAQMHQVFEQVIRNAIDYRPSGMSANITVGAKPGEGQEWAVTIADKGPGIAPDFHSSIFLPFKRLHGREIPGAGMGLAISKRIVEAHGGRMWVESAPGAGACFCFTVRALN